MNERRTRRAAPQSAPLLLALVAVGLVFFLILGLKALKGGEDPAADPAMAAQTTDGTRNSAQDSDTEANHSDAPENGAQPDTELPISTEAVTTEAPTEPIVTEPPQVMMTVDDSYFSDALFVGDSRTDGLWLYSTPGSCKHYSGTSMTIFKIMDTTDEAYGYYGLRGLLQGMQFGKIYIMFGINECGYDTGAFADKYRSVIEEIRSYQPNALIYIQSILYVTQKHESNYPVFATAKIKEKNEAIKAIANDEDIFYLEVNDCLNDGTDHLPSEYTGDGVHLKANYYYLWHDYLLEHAVVDAAHPWTPESESSSEPEGAQAEHP